MARQFVCEYVTADGRSDDEFAADRTPRKWVDRPPSAAIGMALSFWAGKLFQSVIYQVKATDPLTLAAVVLALLSVAALASLLPGIKIARIDPARTLQED